MSVLRPLTQSLNYCTFTSLEVGSVIPLTLFSLQIWYGVVELKMEHKQAREDLTAAGLAVDTASRSLGLGNSPGCP